MGKRSNTFYFFRSRQLCLTPPWIDASVRKKFLTWRLWGSLPAQPHSTLYATPGHAFAAQDRVLGRRASGPPWLKDPQIADWVSTTILVGDCETHFL
jgi:hypothetical protein